MAPVSATAGVIYNSNLQQRAISVKQWVFMGQMAVLVAGSFYPLTHPLHGLHTSLQSLHLACCSSLASTPPAPASLDLHQNTSTDELLRSLPNMSTRPGQTSGLSFRLPDEHIASGLLLVLRLPLGLPNQHTAARSPEHVQGLHGRSADAGRHRDRHKVTLLPRHQRGQTLGGAFGKDMLGADEAAQSKVKRGSVIIGERGFLFRQALVDRKEHLVR